MKKKILSAFLCLFVSVTLAACSSNNTVNDSKKDQTKAENTSVTADAVAKEKIFVTPQWVKSVIDGNQPESKNYVVVEASWGEAKDSPDYTKGHIPGAIHVNTDDVESDEMWNLREPADMEKHLLEDGITSDKTVIVYGSDVSAAGRVAFAYLWAGVENVKIMNGSISAWEKAGYETETKENKPTAAKSFGVKIPAHPEYVMSIDKVKKKLKEDKNFKLVSIRSKDEFLGKTSGYSYIDKAGEPEGAVWGKAGKDASNMDDYTNDDGTYINYDQMLKLWNGLDFNTSNELSFYCGTGWRATVPFLIALDHGDKNISLYDGGWFQWQKDNSLPVQVGDPKSSDVIHTTVGQLSNDKATKK